MTDTITETDVELQLIRRRNDTIGPHSPLMYRRPVHIEQASGVWLTATDGSRYLDAYNNVAHVGHCNPAVVEAIAQQAGRLNVHTRYLNDLVIEYSEQLLSLFDGSLDRVFFTNSGSEANELALRIARQATGRKGVLVTDFSYHGNTIALAEMTTALQVREPLGDHVQALRVPDLDNPAVDGATALQSFTDDLDRAITVLEDRGHGVSAALFDTIFSTEGLPRVPQELIRVWAERVHRAGGLVISDEVQTGFGRLGEVTWGYQYAGIAPDLVTLGKPMGNGHPVGGVITSQQLLEDFGRNNLYFNTFAGNPVSAAAGLAVLSEMRRLEVVQHAADVGRAAAQVLAPLPDRFPWVRSVKGRGMFFGLEMVDGQGHPSGEVTREVVEGMVRRGVLINRVGRHDNVLKIRPPMIFGHDDLDILVTRLRDTLTEVDATVSRPMIL